MNTQNTELGKDKLTHRGRIQQTGIYLGKLFRMFIYQSDWKALPMAAIIAGLVSIVVGKNLYYTMEGTAIGSFALSCVCIWNGCFNSIQVICRERAIVKREHRSGLHMSSYVAANMIYQAFLCLSQSVITVGVLYFCITKLGNGAMPQKGIIINNAIIELFITIFLVSYSANVIALFISAIVRNTTTAMTIMPFLLIFQLIFSGGFFELSEKMMPISNFTVSKWGLTALCAEGHYNELPMVSMWNALFNMQDFELDAKTKETIVDTMENEYHMSDTLYESIKEQMPLETYNIDKPIIKKALKEGIYHSIPDNAKPIKPIVYGIQGQDLNNNQIGENRRDDFMRECAKQNYKEQYVSEKGNVLNCWANMLIFIAVFGILSVISLEFIDRDRR